MNEDEQKLMAAIHEMSAASPGEAAVAYSNLMHGMLMRQQAESHSPYGRTAGRYGNSRNEDQSAPGAGG